MLTWWERFLTSWERFLTQRGTKSRSTISEIRPTLPFWQVLQRALLLVTRKLAHQRHHGSKTGPETESHYGIRVRNERVAILFGDRFNITD